MDASHLNNLEPSGQPTDGEQAVARGSFGSKVAFRLASQFAASASGVAIGIVVARYLGAAGKGDLALIRSAYSLSLQVVLLGMPVAAVYYVGRKKCSPLLTAVVAGAISLVASLAIVAALMLAPPRWLHSVGFRTAEVLAGLSLMLAFVLPLRAVAQGLAGAVRGLEYIKELAAIQMLGMGLLRFLCTLLFVAVLALGLLGAVYAEAVTAACVILATGALLGLVSVRSTQRTAAPPVRGFISYGAQMQAAEVLRSLFARVDVFILAPLAGRAAVGIYSVAMAGSELIPAVAAAVGYVLAPRVALSGDEKGAATTVRVHRLLLWGQGAALPVLCGVAFLVPYVYGSQFQASVVPMLICLPGLSLWGIANHVWKQFFIGSGRVASVFALLVVALVVMVSLDLLLIPVYGAVGAAVAYSAGSAASYIIGLHLFRKASRADLRSLLLPTSEDVQLLRSPLQRR